MSLKVGRTLSRKDYQMTQKPINSDDHFASEEEYQRLNDAEKECEFEID
jgi:hypothetical protein